METLQQILFFREFEIPLKEIKSIMETPALEKNQILQMQRKMLAVKKARMERLIATIDEILEGDNRMDFTVFSKTEIEELFQTMFDHMPDNIRWTAIEEFGSEEEWKKHYIETVSSEDMQKRYAKVVEWYGGKEAFLSAAAKPISREVAESYKKREDAIQKRLMGKYGCDLNSFEVKEIIGEYGFVMKQLCQMKDEKGLMLAMAQSYRNQQARQVVDEKYGDGAAEFFAQAIEAFYKK